MITLGKNNDYDETAISIEAEADLSGRNRLFRNVLSSWAGHLVFIISGFIMPRMIDTHAGQSGLGVWDFGWSLVSYFGFVQAGICSSVNRYMAKYRAVNDVQSVRKIISSVIGVQMIMGLIVTMLCVITIRIMPQILSHQLGDHINQARWVVFWLGMSLAIQILFSPFTGVITGCHRWDLHNALNSGFHIGIVLAWIIALTMGGQLRSLAIINFVGVTITEFARMILAYRICPELKIRLEYINLTDARKILFFGGKSILTTLSRLLLYQTSSLLVVGYLGPAILATYSRPNSLINHAMTIVNKFAFVLTPTASHMHARGQKNELGQLLIETTQYGAYIAFPLITFLVIMGSPLLVFWMGPKYNKGIVLVILALGHLLPMIQQPAWTILSGMNAHGRIGVANLIAAMVSMGLAIVALGVLKWGLIGAALAIVLPLSVIYGFYIPIYTCHCLNLSLKKYILGSVYRPLIMVLPFAACLGITRIIFHAAPFVALLTGAISGALVLGLLYWRYVIPDEIKNRILRSRSRITQQVTVTES
ncbi:MAG: oligosaccharide flippase family protein [Phycisphaerae bacterium]|nr:oligosaccharide flippase family protein [Phycisphaerae bacterium]